MTITALLPRSPFDLADHRKIIADDSEHLTVAEFIQQQKIKLPYPTLVFLNSEQHVLLREEWASLRLQAGDTMIFLPLLQGGGGGGSNPLKVVLGLALLAFAAPLAGFAAGMGLAVTAATVAQFGVAVLLSAFVKRKSSSLAASSDTRSASTTYSIGAQGNVVKLGEPMPKLYGRHLLYPSYSAAPWTYNEGNKQFLVQSLFCTLGQMDIEAVRIEDTPIQNFGGAYWAQIYYDNAGNATVVNGHNSLLSEENLYPPGLRPDNTATAAALFSRRRWHDRVITTTEVSGQLIPAPNESGYAGEGWIGPFTVCRAGLLCNQIIVDLQAPRGLYYAEDNGSMSERVCHWEIQCRQLTDSGTPVGGWFAALSPYNVTGNGTRSHDIPNNDWATTTITVQFDLGVQGSSGFVFTGSTATILSTNLIPGTNGGNDVLIVTATAQTVWESSGDDSYPVWHGSVKVAYAYSYLTTGTVAAFTAATNDAQQWSLFIPVPEARLEVRIRRTDNKDLSSRAGHELRMTGLKAIIITLPQYRDCTVLHTILKATDALSSQSSQKINVIGTGKLPIWDGAQWSSPTATRSPVWAMADVLRAKYGGRLTDKQLAIADLVALAEVTNNRGDYFDYYADQQSPLRDALAMIGESCRIVPLESWGMVRFRRDQLQPLPVMLFTDEQINKGSFTQEWIQPSDSMAAYLIVEYFSSATWQWETLTVGIAPDDPMVKPITHRINGVTTAAQAQREGTYMLVCNQLRRKFVSFTTVLGGYIPVYGDLIAVTHDLPGWGQSAAIQAVDGGLYRITTDTTLRWVDGAQHWIALRKADGALTVPKRCAAVNKITSPNIVRLSAANWSALMAEIGVIRTAELYSHPTTLLFGTSATLYQRVVLTSVKDRGNEQAEISGFVENDAVHNV